MTRKVLVTGASGFIGKQVVKDLIARGYHVVGVNFQHPIGFVHENLRILTVDLLDYKQLENLFLENSFESLIHLAWYGDAKCHSHNINIDWVAASLQLLKRFYENGGKKVLIAGSISEYDFEYGYFKENLTPLNNKSLYGKSKAALYNLSKAYCEQNGIDFKWARIFNLYGQHERPQRLMPYVITSMLKGDDVKVSTCTKFQDYLHVEDVSDAIIEFFESNLNDALNICSGEPVKLKCIVEKIKEITEFKGNILYGSIPSGFEDPVVVGDCTRLIQELAWKPKYSLEEGLISCIGWWKEHIND